MADHFVDTVNGSNGNTGHDMDNAWATFEYAAESGTLVAGDVVWLRRNQSESPGSDIDFAYNGTYDALIKYIGWPRNTASITQGDWTTGSTTVDNVVGQTMDTDKHIMRYVTGPDGNTYLITKITDGNTFIIDKNYAGSTVTGVAGAATIQADPDYTQAQAIDDSGWTIQKTDWNADTDEWYIVDFASAAYRFDMGSKFYQYLANIRIKDSSTYALFISSSRIVILKGVMIEPVENLAASLIQDYSYVHWERVLVSGSAGATHSSQNGVFVHYYGASLRLKDCVFYGLESQYSIYVLAAGRVELEGVNLGVEVANRAGTYDFLCGQGSYIYGRDVKSGNTNRSRPYMPFVRQNGVHMENWQRQLGNHVTFTARGAINRITAGGGGTLANQRAGGSPHLLELEFTNNDTPGTYSMATETEPEVAQEVFVHEFEVDTTSRSYRYYVQSMGILTASQLWIEAEYCRTADSTSSYSVEAVASDETFTARADEDDWAEFMEVTGIQPAIPSKVRIKCYANFYHATDHTYIDPKVVIT